MAQALHAERRIWEDSNHSQPFVHDARAMRCESRSNVHEQASRTCVECTGACRKWKDLEIGEETIPDAPWTVGPQVRYRLSTVEARV